MVLGICNCLVVCLYILNRCGVMVMDGWCLIVVLCIGVVMVWLVCCFGFCGWMVFLWCCCSIVCCGVIRVVFGVCWVVFEIVMRCWNRLWFVN